jgi:hypothetical protein
VSDFDPIKFQIFSALKKQFGVVHGMRTTRHLDEDASKRAASTILEMFKSWGVTPRGSENRIEPGAYSSHVRAAPDE